MRVISEYLLRLLRMLRLIRVYTVADVADVALITGIQKQRIVSNQHHCLSHTLGRYLAVFLVNLNPDGFASEVFGRS